MTTSIAGKASNGDTAWRRPIYLPIHRIIENRGPTAAAYAYGKTLWGGYTAEGSWREDPPRTRNEWLTLTPIPPTGMCLGEG